MRKLLMILFILFIPMTIVGQTTEKAPVVDEMSATLLKRILETAEKFEYRIKDDQLLAIYGGEVLVYFDIYEAGIQCKTYLSDEYDNISLYAINEWNKNHNTANAMKGGESVHISSSIRLVNGVTLNHIIDCLKMHVFLTMDFLEDFR
jgi:hypothetical protein